MFPFTSGFIFLHLMKLLVFMFLHFMKVLVSLDVGKNAFIIDKMTGILEV